jgi:hypothetical protein
MMYDSAVIKTTCLRVCLLFRAANKAGVGVEKQIDPIGIDGTVRIRVVRIWPGDEPERLTGWNDSRIILKLGYPGTRRFPTPNENNLSFT